MGNQEKATRLKEAKDVFDGNLKIIEEAFGKDTPIYEIARKEALSILQQDFSAILKKEA